MLPKSSRVFNRQAVQSTLRSLQARPTLLEQLPPNGLAMFYSDSLSMDIVPLQPLKVRLYHCDRYFHTQCLWDQLSCHETYLYIIISGQRLDLFTLAGKSHQHIYHKEVSLPNKHNKGGQSQNRFLRLHDEKIQNYLTISTEIVHQQVQTLELAGYIVAGSASLKTQLAERLRTTIPNISQIAVVDISYDSHVGFREAVSQTESLITNAELQTETKYLKRYFDLIAQSNSDLVAYCYGQKETMTALKHGLASHILCNQDTVTDELRKTCDDQGIELIEVSNETELGHQFIMGFGGYGALL